jgi:peptidoglycan/LPS O-acetylase OafA/YrhL
MASCIARTLSERPCRQYHGTFFFAAILLWSLLYGHRIETVRWLHPFRTLGDISYGLYLVHVFVFAKYDLAMQRHGLPGINGNFYMLLLRFFVAGSASVGIAWISRKTYGQWFLDLKKYFTTSAKSAAISIKEEAS